MKFNGCDFCLPVFFHSYFLSDGHSEKTENATITFVKYLNRIYAVTCKHIIHHLETKRDALEEEWHTLSIALDRIFLQLSDLDHVEPKKRKDIFRKLKCNFGSEDVDIVIAPMDSHWEMIRSQKNKKAIDLDNWNEPNWSQITMGTAFGYPNEHKAVIGNHVATQCINANAEIVSNLNKDVMQVTLFSSLNQPHGFFFSGLSGGPIFFSNAETNELAGIVYEGQPGSSKDFDEKQTNGAAFFSENDILIKGFIINPQVFSGWLKDAGL